MSFFFDSERKPEEVSILNREMSKKTRSNLGRSQKKFSLKEPIKRIEGPALLHFTSKYTKPHTSENASSKDANKSALLKPSKKIKVQLKKIT